MPSTASSRIGAPVLVLSGVRKVLHAGVSCCRARRVMLHDVDLVVRRGERVAIVSPSVLAGDVLLLVASGAVCCDAGTVWYAPLGARVVAERASLRTRALTWSSAPGTRLAVVASARDAHAATRVLFLVGAVLTLGHRVDSALGAP